MKRSEVIHPKSIQPGDVIVGLSSFGKANYEDEYNSGIGSNGLTLARHGLLHHDYYKKYQECYSPELDENWTFFGKYSLHDKVPQTNLTVGQAILSPTRTYTPILLELFKIDRSQIHAIFHNTGGGQTKCLKFGESLHYYKNNMFADPPFFKLIQESSQTGWKEMYQVFNMGHRMEIICSEDFAKDFVIRTARKYGVESKIIGVVERSSEKHKNYLTIENLHGKFEYSSK